MKLVAGALLVIALGAGLAFGTRLAQADTVEDPAYDEAPPVYVPEFRSNSSLLIGFDGGIGATGGGCFECPFLGGAVIGLYAGAQLGSRVAVLVDLRLFGHPLPSESDPRDGLLLSSHVTAAAQIWLIPDLWLRAGVGANHYAKFVDGPDESRTGPALTLAIGSEQKHRPSFGIDLSLHAAISSLRGRRDREEGRGLLVFIGPVIGAHWN